jgi:purine-binding chemotaxis protein CheW
MQGNATNYLSGNAIFLTFTLAGEEYVVEILHVVRIRGYAPPTIIANTPPFIRGVITLRRTLVPIIDWRITFCLGAASRGQFTVVIVLRIAWRLPGRVVSGVCDVIVINIEGLMASAAMALMDTRDGPA